MDKQPLDGLSRLFFGLTSIAVEMNQIRGEELIVMVA